MFSKLRESAIDQGKWIGSMANKIVFENVEGNKDLNPLEELIQTNDSKNDEPKIEQKVKIKTAKKSSVKSPQKIEEIPNKISHDIIQEVLNNVVVTEPEKIDKFIFSK